MRRLVSVLGVLSLLMLVQGCASTATVDQASAQDRDRGHGLLTGKRGSWKIHL